MLVEVAGIGYEIEAPMSTFYELPDVYNDIFIYTHLTIRDDAHLLYGFAKFEERALFRHLIKINNVGPKLALAILSTLTPDMFVTCIQQNDSTSLERIPGVGKKTAQRLVIEMRDRLEDWTGSAGGGVFKIDEGGIKQDAVSALVALGYKPQQASKMVDLYPSEPKSSEDLIKYALQNM